jgi:hypothetical protein
MNNTCCEPVLDNCQKIAQCFETLTIIGLVPNTSDRLTIQDLFGNEYFIEIEIDDLGTTIVDLTKIPSGFFNSFSRVYFLFFENFVITENNKTYGKLLFKVENIQTNETDARIQV